MWAPEYDMDMAWYEDECIPPLTNGIGNFKMRKRNVFPTIIILAFYGILRLKVRKWRTFTYPFGMDELYVWWLHNFDYNLLQVVGKKASWIKESRWLFIASTKTCWICSKILKIIVFMSSKLIGTIPTMWKDVLMSNIVGNCWLSGH